MTDDTIVYKKIAFLVRRSDLSEAAFRRHWRQVHGPLVARAPGYAAWRRRYVQDHVLGPTGTGPAFPYDGMAEFWLPSANEDLYAESDTYREHVRPDELNFIDMNRTVSMTAEEMVIVPGAGRIKLVVLTTAESLSLAEHVHELQSHVRDIARRLAPRLAGCSLDLVLPGSARLPGARRLADAVPGALCTFRFDRREDASASMADPGLVAPLGPAGLPPTAILVEEVVFFDGRPTS